MARVKIELVCKCCGEKFTHIQFCSKREAAYSYEEWAKKNITVCSECYSENKKAEEKAKQEEEKAKQEETQKNLNLAELSGTEKQIAWAADIRRKAIAIVMNRVTLNEKFINAVNVKTEAKWWIENRNEFSSFNGVLKALSK